MAMGDFESGDNHSNPQRSIHLSLCDPDLLGNGKEMLSHKSGKVGPLIDFLDWHHQCVSTRDWINGQEYDADAVTVDEMTRNLTFNDSCEQSWHGIDCSVEYCVR